MAEAISTASAPARNLLDQAVAVVNSGGCGQAAINPACHNTDPSQGMVNVRGTAQHSIGGEFKSLQYRYRDCKTG